MRLRFRYSLRTLFALLTLSAIASAWWVGCFTVRCANLEELSICGFEKLHASEWLPQMKSLKKLSVIGSKEACIDVLGCLQQMPWLERLEISHYPRDSENDQLSPIEIELIKQLIWLKELRISSGNIPFIEEQLPNTRFTDPLF